MAVAAAESTVPTVVPKPVLSLRLPRQDALAYHGVVNLDHAGMGQGHMMYPAPNAAGLLVGILAHALVVDSTRAQQKASLQATADELLQPYRSSLDGFTAKDLWTRSLQHAGDGHAMRLIEPADAAGEGHIVDIAPVFRLTQDQRALLLDGDVSILAPGAAPDAARRLAVRVVSTPWGSASDEVDPATYWGAEDGERLKNESATLLAQALGVAIGEVTGDVTRDVPTEAAPFRTVRYAEGHSLRMERAQVVSTRCGRMIIRTLRGALMSVPASPPEEALDASCSRMRASR